MRELHLLSASEAARRIAAGSLTSEALVRACLERIDAREMSVCAFAFLDPDHVIRQAQACDRRSPAGPLHGVPIAFKDIIDTRDMPTQHGSRFYRDNRPMVDAACVAAARAAGAVILGKTVTTEFAGRHPGPTSHPHNRLHSPGGSSSGSAAAVADFMVPLAVGSQTAGSTIRPASYCGVYGYKPTFGLFSFSGVHHFAESFDTLGLLARSLDDIALLRDTLLKVEPAPGSTESRTPPRVALCRTPSWERAEPPVRQCLMDAAERLARAGASVVELQLPAEFDNLEEATWSIVHFELVRALAPEWQTAPENLAGTTRRMIDRGLGIPLDQYLSDMKRIERLRPVIHELLGGCDVVLTPSAVGEAPVGLEDTGPVTFNFLWHVMNMPAITIPAFTGPKGLPIGIQLVGRRYEDDLLLRCAGWAARHLVTARDGGPKANTPTC